MFSSRDQRGWGADYERLARGGLALSTEARLERLTNWGGYSSFMTPSGFAAANAADIEPVGQVVGMSFGAIHEGWLRTTRPGQGRSNRRDARWRERTGPVTSWTALRMRALARLTQQAMFLRAHAVVGVEAVRQTDDEFSGGMTFTGTAVRVRELSRAPKPVLTLASPQELWAMLRAGVHPAGIAGGFASVETLPSRATRWAALAPNAELADLSESVYEVRRLAMKRLIGDARSLEADGLLGVDLKVEHGRVKDAPRPRPLLTAHVLAFAVKRVRAAPSQPEPVLRMGDGG